MLSQIREKFTGWIALAILGLIALTFVFVGGANFAFIGSNYAAKVDDVEIGLGRFEQAYRDQIQQNPQFAQLPDEQRFQLRRNILDQLIQQRVVDNYILSAGFQVDDDDVMRLIRQTPEFQIDGEFDMDTYRNTLAINQLDPTTYEHAQRQTLRRYQLERAIRGSALVSPAAFRRYLNLAGEQRIVTLATLDPEETGSGVEVTDEMIAAFYDDNPTLYQQPESVDVEYVEILRSEVADSVDLTEERIVEYYESNRDLYLQDAQRQARHILILFGDDETVAEDKAKGLLARIDAGEPFEDLARSNSDDTLSAGRGGDLGALTEEQLPAALAGVVFDMREGDVAGPIRSDFGFHIVRLDAILEQGPQPLEQVRAELTAALRDEEAESLYRDLERQLSDALFDADDIRALASAVGVPVKTATGFSRRGGEPLGSDAAVVDAVFDEMLLEGGQLSEIIEIGNGRSAVVAVTDHRPATRKPLEDVRDEIAQTVRSQEAERIMAARADEMITALEGGSDFADVAQAVGATPAEPVVMMRNDPNADRFVQVAVFTAVKPGQDEPTLGTTRNGMGGYTVYSIEAALPGRPESIPIEQRDEGKAQLTDRTGLGEFLAFIQALREESEVIVNEDAIASQDFL
ncbi:MAG: SurA N-terminal domain-containing protein [Proteobacteria bacterium]|nr:SurA N-terminal domain-containing protein [Pseudomonadota bacterium]